MWTQRLILVEGLSNLSEAMHLSIIVLLINGLRLRIARS